MNRLDLCLEFINLLLELLKGRTPCALEAMNRAHRRVIRMRRTKPAAAAIPRAFQGLSLT